MAAKRKIVSAPQPHGLFYIPNFITAEQHDEILAQIENLPFSAYVMGAYEAKRTVVQYGGQEYRVSYGGNQSIDELPRFIEPIREKAASLLRLEAQALEQILVARYENAGIGWHRDAPQFGPTVIGLSIGGQNTMRFRRLQPDIEELFRIDLAPRSLYVMSGAARSDWQHSMPPSKELRFSITFRTINSKFKEDSVRQDDIGLDTHQQPSSIAERLAELNLLSRPVCTEESAQREKLTQLKLAFPA